jgi:tetrahydromethanopterin S-methyltransferase subunit G
MDLKNEIDARQTGGASSGNLEALAKTKAELVALVRRVDGIEKAGRGSESASVTSSGYAVEKQDFQDLRSRLAQLERNVEDYGGAAANVDTKNNIVQVQRDLSALSRRLDNLETKGTLQTIAQKDIATKQDLDEVRQTLAQLKKATGHDDVSDITDEMKKSTDLTQKEFARLNRRVDEIERNATFEGKDASGSVRQYASGLAKVALGLGMVAAFFIAR